jgi:protein phosphatase
VGWYARHTYYVGLDGNRVAIFKGRPGGLLWFQPTLDQRKDLTTADILPSRLADLKGGHQEPTRADAQRYITRLREEAVEAHGGTTTTGPPTTAKR